MNLPTQIKYTKQLTIVWSVDPPEDFIPLARAKLDQMIDQNKTDGQQLSTTQGTSVRRFADQESAEEYRDWIISERVRYGHTPSLVEITDI